MAFLIRMAVIFFVTIITLIGLLVILFVLPPHFISFEHVQTVLLRVYNDSFVSNIVAAVTAVIMLKAFCFGKIIVGRQKKERTIAFENPSGQVSVSLTAIEDLARRTVNEMPEIKEIRPSIVASKRGLEVEIRLVLQKDVNIPELTGRLQNLIKDKIQDAIGIEENINIRVHVIKIVDAEPKVKKSKDKNKPELEELTPEPNVPFHGYRA